MHLVESKLSISQVADEFGYADIYLFSRQFKEETGLSPRNYRERATRTIHRA